MNSLIISDQDIISTYLTDEASSNTVIKETSLGKIIVVLCQTRELLVTKSFVLAIAHKEFRSSSPTISSVMFYA